MEESEKFKTFSNPDLGVPYVVPVNKITQIRFEFTFFDWALFPVTFYTGTSIYTGGFTEKVYRWLFIRISIFSKKC